MVSVHTSLHKAKDRTLVGGAGGWETCRTNLNDTAGTMQKKHSCLYVVFYSASAFRWLTCASMAWQGKDKPTFSNHEDNGDIVIVKNARHIALTGRKWDQKVYKWHSG